MILYLLIDYEILRLIWWVLLGVLLIGFAVMDGFDLGVETLLPFVARTDIERRIVINSIGPVWEGNQVWLILAGGAIFAAWPPLYAVSFSGFYFAMFIALFALILRPVSFKYRSKRESAAWRNSWDWALFIGGFVPALIFGVAVGNVLQGVPFRFNEHLQIFYEGTFLELLNPFALLCGVLSVVMMSMHGASWLVLKTSDELEKRARKIGTLMSFLTILLFVGAGIWLWQAIPGFRIVSEIIPDGPSNPLYKTVVIEQGAWLANFSAYPALWAIPALGILGALAVMITLNTKSQIVPLIMGKISIFGIITTVGVSIFPFILPSSLNPNASLTVWDSSSSHMTLFNMLVAVAIFMPLIILYTSWVYKVLWGKVKRSDVEDSSGHAY